MRSGSGQSRNRGAVVGHLAIVHELDLAGFEGVGHREVGTRHHRLERVERGPTLEIERLAGERLAVDNLEPGKPAGEASAVVLEDRMVRDHDVVRSVLTLAVEVEGAIEPAAGAVADNEASGANDQG